MLIHFFLGLISAYIGGIPFGPLNLSVVEITLSKGKRSASRFSFAASLVEIGEAAVAILFGTLIASKLEQYAQLNFVVIIFFFGLGLYFLIKKDHPKTEKQAKDRSSFPRGIITAILNPQAIPYWLFVLAYLDAAQLIQLKGNNVLIFLLGVFVGKYFILSSFGILSEYLKPRIGDICNYLSKAIGIILIGIGAFQFVRLYW